MSQITLYLDEATQALVEREAAASGLSRSRWVAELIQRHAATQWAADQRALAGRFADFPLRQDGAPEGQDAARVGF